MKFPGVLKNSKQIFQGLIKNNIEFLGVIKKKSFGISRGIGWMPKISDGCNRIVWSFQG